MAAAAAAATSSDAPPPLATRMPPPLDVCVPPTWTAPRPWPKRRRKRGRQTWKANEHVRGIGRAGGGGRRRKRRTSEADASREKERGDGGAAEREEERSRWCVQREGVEGRKTTEKRAESATKRVGARKGVRMPRPRVGAMCLAKMARGARTKSSNTKHVRHRNGQEWETKDRRMILQVILLAPYPHSRARSIDGIHELLGIRVEECRRRYAVRTNERTHP